jgi:hypothetical protein
MTHLWNAQFEEDLLGFVLHIVSGVVFCTTGDQTYESRSDLKSFIDIVPKYGKQSNAISTPQVS